MRPPVKHLDLIYSAITYGYSLYANHIVISLCFPFIHDCLHSKFVINSFIHYLISGDGRPSPYTERFCEYKPNKLYRHPNSPKWFISCGGGEGVSGICQRCDPAAELELNEDCQMCLYPGESKLQKSSLYILCPKHVYCGLDTTLASYF